MKRPNIIFILMDDLGWRDLGCYGSSFYETPRLDELAARGLRFTNAYAAAPVCSPTRASILTGKYPARVGLTHFLDGDDKGKLLPPSYIHHLPLEETCIASLLREAGYKTWHVGKWHLGSEEFWPNKFGFDCNIGGCEIGAPFRGGYFSPYAIATLADGPDGEYLTDRLTDEAIGLLENHLQKGERAPFFLNLWHYAVHIPIQAPAALIEKYRAKAQRLGLADQNPFEEGEFFPCDHKKHHRVLRRRIQSDPAYAAMVENMDWNIGRLVEALERHGLMENTLLMFTSDNGGVATAEGSPTCNAPLAEGKGWMYEGGLREPLIAVWPGTIKPGICEVPVTSPDFYPTFLEVAGLPFLPRQHCDGLSLEPLLRGASALEREAIFWHFPHYGNQGGTPGSAVRAGKWKLNEWFETDQIELFDLEADEGEVHNLAATQPRIAAALKEKLAQWRRDVQAKLPTENAGYDAENTRP